MGAHEVEWEVMVASHCYWQGRWWLDILWVAFTRLWPHLLLSHVWFDLAITNITGTLNAWMCCCEVFFTIHNMHNIVLWIARLFYSFNFEDLYGQVWCWQVFSWKQVHNVLGDEGLKMLGKTCMELRCLWIEDDDASCISHSGVVAISQGCAKLQHMALYVYDITNVALAMVG